MITLIYPTNINTVLYFIIVFQYVYYLLLFIIKRKKYMTHAVQFDVEPLLNST